MGQNSIPLLLRESLYLSDFHSDPDRILTCDLQNRNLTFYTAELPGPF